MKSDEHEMGKSVDNESEFTIKDNIVSNKQASSIIDDFISKNPEVTIPELTKYLMSQGHIAIQNGKDTIIYGKDSRMEDSPIVKIEKAGEMVGNVQPILVTLENGTKYDGNLYLESSPANKKYQLEVTRQVVDTPEKTRQIDLEASEELNLAYLDLFTQINDDIGPEGSDFLLDVVHPTTYEPITETIKTALEEEGIVPLENGVYKSVDPEIKEMFEEAYKEMLSSNWKDATVLNAYKKVMEYIKSVYEMAENGEIMDNDCPITITLTI